MNRCKYSDPHVIGICLFPNPHNSNETQQMFCVFTMQKDVCNREKTVRVQESVEKALIRILLEWLHLFFFWSLFRICELWSSVMLHVILFVRTERLLGNVDDWSTKTYPQPGSPSPSWCIWRRLVGSASRPALADAPPGSQECCFQTALVLSVWPELCHSPTCLTQKDIFWKCIWFGLVAVETQNGVGNFGIWY